MIQWLEDIANRRRVKRCVRRLGPSLRKDYGRGPFTAGQVRTAAEAKGMDETGTLFAYNLYCPREELDRLNEDDPETAKKIARARSTLNQIRLARRDAAILMGLLGAAAVSGDVGFHGGGFDGGFDGSGFDGGGFDGGGGG